MPVLTLDVVIGDLAFFKDLVMFLSLFSYRSQFFHGAWELHFRHPRMTDDDAF
jgi:hypothetical protein